MDPSEQSFLQEVLTNHDEGMFGVFALTYDRTENRTNIQSFSEAWYFFQSDCR